jgi:UDP-glucose 4-epimerase
MKEDHIRDGAYATVLGIFEKQFMNKESLTITSDGEQRRDFTHVDDIVDGLVRCVGKDFRAEEFEFGSGVNHSINELADMFGKDYPKKYIPKRPGEYDMTLCTDKKAHKLLNWKPTENIEDYVQNWIEENK